MTKREAIDLKYNRWLEENGLPKMCAVELYHQLGAWQDELAAILEQYESLENHE